MNLFAIKQIDCSYIVLKVILAFSLQMFISFSQKLDLRYLVPKFYRIIFICLLVFRKYLMAYFLKIRFRKHTQ